jgi:hypothetical protein
MAVEAQVVRARRRRGGLAAPAEPGIAGDPHPGLAAERLHDAEELGGAKGSAMQLETRREVVDAEGPVARIAPASGGAGAQEPAARALVEQGREHRLGVEARQAAPDHAAVAPDEGGELAVADEAAILEPHGPPPRGTHPLAAREDS